MWGALIGAGLGAVAGSQKDKTDQTSSVNVAPASQQELAATAGIGRDYAGMQGLVNMGPGQQDVANAIGSQRGLADMLSQYAKGGFLPSEADVSTANKFAATQFDPQRIALQQQFQGQQQRAAQLASQLGRPVNDPIIQARLSQEHSQSQERLMGSQGAFASQMAQQMPMQRLGFTSQLADVQSNLASQAMANRQALLGLGSQIQGAERNWRLGTASRTNSQESGGGFKGALTGALGGAAGFMGLSNMASQGNMMNAQQGFYEQMPGAMVQAAAAGRPVTNNYGAGAAAAAGGAMLPQNAYMMGPQQMPTSSWTANTSSTPFYLQQPASMGPNLDLTSSNPSYMMGVGNTQFTPQFAGNTLNQFGFYTP